MAPLNPFGYNNLVCQKRIRIMEEYNNLVCRKRIGKKEEYNNPVCQKLIGMNCSFCVHIQDKKR